MIPNPPPIALLAGKFSPASLPNLKFYAAPGAASTLYSDTAATTPATAAGTPVRAIRSSVGSLVATRTAGDCTLRLARAGSAPSVWCGGGAAGGWTISGINLASSAEWSVFYLHRIDQAAVSASAPFSLFPSDPSNSYRYPSTAGNQDMFSTGSGGTQVPFYPLQAGQPGTLVGNTGLWEAVAWVGTGGNVFVHRRSVRGLEIASVAATWGPGAVSSMNLFGGQAILPYAGEWAAVGVVDRGITASEAARTLAALLAGVPTRAPSSAPLVLFDGNSITLGVGGTVPGSFPAQVATANTPQAATFLNYGRGGRTSELLSAAFPISVAPLFAGRTAPDVLFFEELGNSIEIGDTAPQAFAAAKAYCTQAKAALPATAKLVISSCTPRTSNLGSLTAGQFETARQAARSSLMADFPTATATPYVYLPAAGVTYADMFLDMGAVTGIGATADCAGANYSDGCHFTNAGYAVRAGAIESALSYLGTATRAVPPTCPGLVSWHGRNRGITPDSTGTVAAVAGDVAANWTPSFGNYPLSGVNSPRLAAAGLALDGSTNWLTTGAAFPLPFPLTWVVVGTLTGTPANFAAFLLSVAGPPQSGLLAVSGNLGYQWNAGTQYTFTTGPALPAVGTYALLACSITPTGATLFVRTAAGLSQATHATTLAATSPATGTFLLGRNGSSNFETPITIAHFLLSNQALAAADIDALWASLPS